MRRRLHVSVGVLIIALAFSACGGGGNSPAPPTLTVSGFPAAGMTQTLAAASTYALTATETASGGGSVAPGALTITLGNAAIGSVSGSTLVTGVGNAAGTVKVVDSKTNVSETFAVSVLTTLPAALGDTRTLAGTLVHTITRPLPAPVATEAPVTTTESVTDAIKVASTTASFAGKGGFTDENVIESDVAPLQTLTTTSDAYTGFVPSGSLQDLFEAGATSTDSNGVTDSTTFGAGAGLLDELPDTNGATWTNTAALTFAETEPDATTVARTVAAGGTYSETDDFSGQPAAPETIVTHSDLSASITGFAGLDVDVAYGPPSAGASSTIPYTVTITQPSPPGPFSGTVPNWFPTTTLFTDGLVKATAQTLPASCAVPSTAVPSTAATAVVKITETTTRLDPAFGTFEKRTQNVYEAPGFGSVCVQLADEIDSYYDYTSQSAQVIVLGLNFALSATPIQIDTLAETLGLTAGAVSGSSAARAQATVLSRTALLRAVTPLFDRAVEAVYRSSRDAQRRYVLSRRATLPGGVSR